MYIFMNWSQFNKGIFLVNVLGIVYDFKTKRILIGKRENDPYIKELSWCFPGGRPNYNDDLEFYLKSEVKAKTNVNVEIEQVIFAKTYPEKREFLSIYYLCKPIENVAKAGDGFVEVKWIKPIEVNRYFTTSIHPKILQFLKKL